ncbi:MAG: transcription termination/antitermination protein NusG [Mariprofundales bacterium]|nr:transcription termination/antitermination protein NusG [Mariprofundales bacterium]
MADDSVTDSVEKRWYAIQAFSGSEDKVAEAIAESAEKSGQREMFGEILVPREDVVELKNGQKTTTQRKFFPGYVLVEMAMTDATWHVINSVRNTLGFLGSGGKPRPMPLREIEAVKRQIEEGIERPRMKVLFDVGEDVRVTGGPFASFNGVVEEVQEDSGKLIVSVSIFGRPTPVELDFSQVAKN